MAALRFTARLLTLLGANARPADPMAAAYADYFRTTASTPSRSLKVNFFG